VKHHITDFLAVSWSEYRIGVTDPNTSP